MLTDKCKIEFEKFCELNKIGYVSNGSFYVKFDICGILLQNLSLTVQHALIIEFFDSVGICVLIERSSGGFWYLIKEEKEALYSVSTQETESETRQEASNSAIEKANQLFNLK